MTPYEREPSGNLHYNRDGHKLPVEALQMRRGLPGRGS